MKIEKINENQIRCTLTRADLEKRQIKLSELAYGSEKARALFREMMLQAFQGMIRKGVHKDDVAGPVGLVRVVGQASSYGIESYLMLLALVSLNLAFFNIIPIPGLDGGKIFFILLKVISGGRINDDMEYKATVVGMALLIALFVLVTYNDIMNIFN